VRAGVIRLEHVQLAMPAGARGNRIELMETLD
jgi:hypothetical protein